MKIQKIASFHDVKVNIQLARQPRQKFEITYKKEEKKGIKILSRDITKKGQTIYIIA